MNRRIFLKAMGIGVVASVVPVGMAFPNNRQQVLSDIETMKKDIWQAEQSPFVGYGKPPWHPTCRCCAYIDSGIGEDSFYAVIGTFKRKDGKSFLTGSIDMTPEYREVLQGIITPNEAVKKAMERVGVCG